MNKWETINNLYIKNNLKIFPLIQNGKRPLINKWQEDCSYDVRQILYWYKNAPDCNWGLPANENNLFIIDLDVHDKDKNGIDNFNKLLNDIGYNDSINTLTQTTPSGGLHIIYKSDDELKDVSNNSNVFKDYPGIDFRTSGYIVVEPSTINNNGYVLMDEISKINEMPSVLKEYILKNASTKEDKKKVAYTRPDYVEIGNRDTALFEYINNLYYKTRLSYEEILTLANYFNEEILEEPFKEREVEYKVKKAWEKTRPKCVLINISDE